jgi:catechol 2,3-dioxygenase-like lactoylglutathione lyase family enzyme
MIHPPAVEDLDLETYGTLSGFYHACLPVSDVERAADWFADVFGFERRVTFEDEGSVASILLEHPSGPAILLRADLGRAAALANSPALAFAVENRAQLQTWANHFSRLGVAHTEVAMAHLGWGIRLWGPDLIELRITTPAPLDGVADHS